MRLVTMDLVVRDVPAATRFFTEVVGLTPKYAEESFAEIDTGSASIMLTAELMVDSAPARGAALHFEVGDVTAEIDRMRAAGATILLEPTATDWGTEMAMIAGPEQVVISLFRVLA
jgi:predicted enzyme related to lactoylglutathione lyase